LRFALAAALIPLGIRSVPEIIVGPYLIGWDTIASYVPNTLDWAAGRVGFGEMLGVAPLLYAISTSIYILSGINPVWIFKVMGPILYAWLMVALFRFLKVGLDWNDRRALGGTLLTSLYFITLRLSWDLYRNMLGLTFILLSLSLFRNWKSLRNQASLSVLTILAVAADQLTGTIVLFLVGTRALGELLNRRPKEFLQLARLALPGAVLFISIVYAFAATSGQNIVHEQPPIPTLGGLSSSLGYLGYAYLPIALLIFLGMKTVRSPDLRNWCVVCTGGMFTGLLPFVGLIAMSPEWSDLLTIPFCVYAAAGLAVIVEAPRAGLNWVAFLHAKILPIFTCALALSAALYIALPAQQAMPYYTAFPTLVPTSLVQNTVPLSDMEGLRIMLGWVALNMGPGAVLITHQAIYGWARAYLPPGDHLVNYGFSSPLLGVKMASLAGYTSMFLIWWDNESQWLGQANIPTGFVAVARSGNIAVYAHYLA
jgi:hypothetical protein